MRRSIEYGQQKGRPPTPEQVAFLDSEPDDDRGISIMTRAFAELSSCRLNGMGIGPIPWTAMVEWARYHDLTREITTHLINVLRFADDLWIRRETARLKAKT